MESVLLVFLSNLKRLFLLLCNWFPLSAIYAQAKIMSLKALMPSIEVNFDG